MSKKKVLEVGAGNGYFSDQLRKVCNLTVIDTSKHQLKSNPTKNQFVGSVYKLPFKDNDYDIVFSSNLLHHLNEPLKAINEMKRVASSNIIFSEPNRNNPFLFLGALLIKHERNSIKYSKKFISRLIEKANIKIKYHTYIGGMVMPLFTPRFALPLLRPKSKSILSFFQLFICEK